MNLLKKLAPLVALVAATATIATPAGATEPSMSDTRAGNHYLKASCAVNEGTARFYRIVYGSDDTFWAPEFKDARKERVQTAAATYAAAEYRFAQRLQRPPAAWPADVRYPIRRMIALNVAISNAATDISVARGGQRVIDKLNRIDELLTSSARKARVVRLRLGLGINGSGCS